MLRLLVALCLIAGSVLANDAGLVALPPLAARVTDLTATLSADQRTRLEEELAAVEKEKGTQLAVLILPSTQPESIEQFGIRLAEAWKIGRRGVNDGAIIIVAKDDHRMRIEVGYGLEGAIPDAVAKRVIAEVMTPQFKQGDYAGGLDQAVQALAGIVAGEPLPPPKPVADSVGGGPTDSHFVFLIGSILLAGFLRALLGLGGIAVAALVAGWFAWTIFASWLAVAAAAAITLVVGLMAGAGRGWSRGSPSSGGGFWSSSGGSSSGGGFSGGGGSFGGGGASGGW